MVKLRTLQIWWNEFNVKYFEQRLTWVPITITRSRRTYGYFYVPETGGQQVIRISGPLNNTVELLQDTLLHEMIHQYLHQINVADWDSHGERFQQEYLRICGKNYSAP